MAQELMFFWRQGVYSTLNALAGSTIADELARGNFIELPASTPSLKVYGSADDSRYAIVCEVKQYRFLILLQDEMHLQQWLLNFGHQVHKLADILAAPPAPSNITTYLLSQRELLRMKNQLYVQPSDIQRNEYPTARPDLRWQGELS